MAQVIGTNVASLNAQRNLNTSQAGLQTSLQRLSSGMRINSAKDDAAGLAISQRFTAQINGADQAARNANDGISLAQTAEGSLSSTTDSLQRIRQLAVQAANVTNTATDRAAIQVEVSSLKAEIDRVGNNSSFNGVKLLNGSSPTFNFQVGANTSSNDAISVSGLPTATLAGLSTVPSWTGTGTLLTGAAGANVDGITNTITVNGVNIGIVVNGSSASTQGDNTAAAVNSVTAQTGVTATNTAGVLTFQSTSALAPIVTATGATAIAALGSNAVVGLKNPTTYSTSLNAVALSAAIAGGATNFIKINGVDIGALAATGTTATLQAGLIVTAANAVTGQTGVTVSNTGGTLSFSSTSGTFTVTSGGTGISALGGVASISGTASGGLSNLDVSTVAGAKLAIDQVDSALGQVNLARANLGAAQNRFASVVTDLQTTSENLSASRSRIQDTDFAAETAALTKNQILQQAGTAMLAQANSLPNNVLTLLKG